MNEATHFLSQRGIIPTCVDNLIVEENKLKYAISSVKYPDYVLGEKYRTIKPKKIWSSIFDNNNRKDNAFIAKRGNWYDHTLIICEGETDAMLMATIFSQDTSITVWGLLGSNGWNIGHAKTASEFAHVFVMPDNDTAGNKLLQAIQEHIDDCVAILPPIGEDISDYVNNDPLAPQQLRRIIKAETCQVRSAEQTSNKVYLELSYTSQNYAEK